MSGGPWPRPIPGGRSRAPPAGPRHPGHRRPAADVGHESLWIFRDCLSGEILLAESLLSSTAPDLAGHTDQARRALPVPITGAVSDGQESIRKAVAKAHYGVPHQLCHFHYLREAAKPS